MQVDLVCEGGGVKIGGLVGAIKTLEQKDFQIGKVAGASAGAIVGSLKAAGFSGQELENLLVNLNFKRFLDGSRFLTLYNWLVNMGIYKGDAFYEFMKEQLSSKGVYTFGDLVRHEKKGNTITDFKNRWKLKVIATDIAKNDMVVFPDDAEKYGVNPDRLEVALTVRMSMSLPYFFRPAKSWGSWFIDGGATSNFPIWLFDAKNRHEFSCPTFGLLLDGGEYDRKNDITGWWTYTRAITNTMLQAQDRKFIHPSDFEHRIIKIPTNSIGTADFGLSVEKKKWLVESGEKAAEEFLANWSWIKYKNWARKRMLKRYGR